MKLGLKVNADRESFIRLSDANPEFVEVWFNVNAVDSYTELFDELTRRNCDVGLHFWGTLEKDVSPNIAYPDETIIAKSMNLMRQTIDIATSHHFQYVNIHPGAAALSQVNYQAERYDLVSDAVDMERATAVFLKNAAALSDYARINNVVFTVETVPLRITDGWYETNARLKPKNIYELPADAIIQAARSGMWVANDFCHTAANMISDEPDAVWTFLKNTTKILAPQTRLIHLGFVTPPYNGTDNHDELDNPLLDTNQAVPNTRHIIELLQLFQNRDDVWVLAEPKKDHVKNYFLAKKLLEIAKKPNSGEDRE